MGIHMDSDNLLRIDRFETDGGRAPETPVDTPAIHISDAKGSVGSRMGIPIPSIDRASLRHLKSSKTKRLPVPREVARITKLLEAFVLHGYRDDRVDESLLSQEIEDCLMPQISASLQFDGIDKPLADRRAREMCEEFAQTLPTIIERIDEDISFAYRHDPAASSPDIIPLCSNGIAAITHHRLAHQLWIRGEKRVSVMMSLVFAKAQTGIDIHPGATIDAPFFIDHGNGVVIGETSHIGKYVRIYQGSTIGAAGFSYEWQDGELVIKRDPKRHPTIQDNVTIYANATILGGKTVIGHGAIIGANSWVTKSIPVGYRTWVEDSGETRRSPIFKPDLQQ